MKLLRVVGCVVMTMMLSACSAPKREAENVRVYPQSVARGETLDVQVFRDGRTMTATNTSTRVFGESTLWVNKRFGHPLPGWLPGQTISLDLNTFYDEFGESFRGGGFFARETPEDIVLVEVQTQGASGPEMVGLVTVAGQARKQ